VRTLERGVVPARSHRETNGSRTELDAIQRPLLRDLLASATTASRLRARIDCAAKSPQGAAVLFDWRLPPSWPFRISYTVERFDAPNPQNRMSSILSQSIHVRL
jgi:hypothetical protein